MKTYYISPAFGIYEGDKQPNDREATAQEVSDYQALIAQAQSVVVADQSAISSAKADAVIQYLVSHTPAECSAYVATNVTNLATAVSLLQKIAMALCVLSKDKLK